MFFCLKDHILVQSDYHLAQVYRALKQLSPGAGFTDITIVTSISTPIRGVTFPPLPLSYNQVLMLFRQM